MCKESGYRGAEIRVEKPEQMLREGTVTPFPNVLCEKVKRYCLTL